MSKIRSKILETEDRRTVILDKETQANLWAIMYKIREITQSPLTEQQAKDFVFSMLDVHFLHSDDILELEDKISGTAECLTVFAEKLKGGARSE